MSASSTSSSSSSTPSVSTTGKFDALSGFHVDPSQHRDSHFGCPFLSSNTGVRIGSDDNTLRAGPRGPGLLEDFYFREKMTHFDHERIPERVVHARGTAAHGYFKAYSDKASKYTSAKVLTDPSRETPVFVRFSTILGSRGSADTVRDVRGFATRFYTQEGNWDLVGNNIPIFFVQDALKFVDLIHSGKPEPHNEIPQGQTAHDNFWDFISLMPESTHMFLWALSDRAIPRSYRTQQGFGVNTFVLVNDKRERFFVKFHWRPALGVHSLVWDEAVKINGADPDFHRRDLYEAIENGAYPEWELGIQVVPEADEEKFDFDLLDCTKLIPEELVPVEIIGKMTLNRNVAEFFTETEQVAFCTQNIVPGIDFSDDPILQGRNFSYLDTQLTRLGGPNFHELPINRPLCPVLNNNRDGFMKHLIHPGKFNYFPNRATSLLPANAVTLQKDGPVQINYSEESERQKLKDSLATHSFVDYPARVAGLKARLRGPKFQDHFSQARLFYHSLSPVEKEHLIAAAKFELGHVDDFDVRKRMIDRLNHVDRNIALAVAPAIGIPVPEPIQFQPPSFKSAALSQLSFPGNGSLAGRKVAYLLSDGYDAAQLRAVMAAVKAKLGSNIVVSTRKGTIFAAGTPKSADVTDSEDTNCARVKASFTIHTSRSVLFDALVVVDGAESVAGLSQWGESVTFVTEAFKHQKAILAIGSGIQLLHSAHLPTLSSAKFAAPNGKELVVSQGVVTVPSWEAVSASPLVAAAASAATAVTHVVGKETEVLPPNGAIAAFIDGATQHRAWDRDVVRVPA